MTGLVIVLLITMLNRGVELYNQDHIVGMWHFNSPTLDNVGECEGAYCYMHTRSGFKHFWAMWFGSTSY